MLLGGFRLPLSIARRSLLTTATLENAELQVSVIISTYNQPEWLAKTLTGYTIQEVAPSEIVIADDGSTDRTRQVIESFRGELACPIKHVWHEDLGFRKTLILNEAIRQSTGDYLIFTDGDCIPRRDYVATHRRHAHPSRFLSGGLFRLPMSTSREITSDDIHSGRIFSASWLVGQGVPLRPSLLKATAAPWIAPVLDRLTTTRATWNGCNASCFRQAAWEVGGFDERMHYGGEDREFGERLVNLGLKPRQLRYSAALLHLDHSRGYVKPELIRRNLEIRRETVRTFRVRTPYGLGSPREEAAA